MRKKIVYISRLDPQSLTSWSGTTYFILQSLKKTNNEVIVVGPLSNRVRFFYLLKRFFLSLFNVKFDIDRPILVAKDFAKQINNKIKNIDYDLIVTSDTTTVAFLKTKKPIYIWTDILFSTYYSHYFSNIKISKDTTYDAEYCERLTLLKAKKIILTSNWAINDAIKNYNIKRNKFTLLPFGANLLDAPKKIKVLEKVHKKKNNKVCILISVGVNWERKGMDKAINLLKELNKNGQKANLYIVGSNPPKEKIPKNVFIINFLNKHNAYDKRRLYNILYKSHFNILFTKAEGCGIIFAEASAFGLYSITHNLGGVSGMIKNGFNGFRFDPEVNNFTNIANYVIKIFNDKNLYVKKSLSSRNEFDKRLNWNTISKKLKKILTT